MAASPAGARHLEQACQDALAMLREFNAETIVDAGPAQEQRPLAKLLQQSNALVFMWSISAGLGLGITRGSGFVISYDQGRWSAPCFVTTTTGQAGVVLGVEKVSSLMVALTRDLADRLKAGEAVMDGDVSAQIFPIRGTHHELEAHCKLWDTADLVTVSSSKGLKVDWAVKWGAMTIDEARNAECYGVGTSPRAILAGEVVRAAAIEPIYQEIAAIIKAGSN